MVLIKDWQAVFYVNCHHFACTVIKDINPLGLFDEYGSS